MLKFVFYTNWFIPARFGATTYGPFVFVRPKYKGTDEGLLQHELTHVKQFWRNPLFGLWYFFSKNARYKYELEAYRVQLKYYTDNRAGTFAWYLVNNYKLHVPKDQVLQDLLA
jgi:hypothetical protein